MAASFALVARLSTAASRAIVALGLLASLASTGCDGGADAGSEPGCRQNTDCEPPLWCVGGECVAPATPDASAPAAGAKLQVLTPALTFVNVARGETASASVRVRNGGSDNLVIRRAALLESRGRMRLQPQPQPQDFRVDVPPEAVFTFRVTFTAERGEPFTSELVLESNDATRRSVHVPVAVQYTGEPELIVTREPTGQRAASLANKRVALGPIAANTSRSVAFYIKNVGTGGAHAVSSGVLLDAATQQSVRLDAAADADGLYRLAPFAAFCSNDAHCPAPASCDASVCTHSGRPLDAWRVALDVTVAAGVERALTVRLPYRNAASQVAGNRVLEWTVTAEGVAPAVVLRPQRLDFGRVSPGFPKARLVRVHNASQQPRTVVGVSARDAASGGAESPIAVEVLGDSLPKTLQPGQVLRARVGFHARRERLGERRAWLNVALQDGTLVSARVRGIAAIGPLFSTNPVQRLSFGAVAAGTESVRTVLIRHRGPADAQALELRDVALVGVSGPGKIELGDWRQQIPVGEDAAVPVKCAPEGRGTLQARLRLRTNSPDNPLRTLDVACEGVTPRMRWAVQTVQDGSIVTGGAETLAACRQAPERFSAPCMDFGNVYRGAQQRLALALTNAGDGALALQEPRISGAAAAHFSVRGDTSPLAAAETRRLQLVFDAPEDADAQPLRAQLHIEHNDPSASPLLLTLVGAGVGCAPGEMLCETAACAAQPLVTRCCHTDIETLSCGAPCGFCAAPDNAVARCDAEACTYQCRSGWVDRNARRVDGCERACSASPSPVETCNRTDDDCDGLVDEGLDLADAGGREMPSVCTPADPNSVLGVIDAQELAAAGGPEQAGELMRVRGRLYQGDVQPSGDADWYRLYFREGGFCDAVGFRLGARLQAPQGVDYRICAGVRAPGAAPLLEAACPPRLRDCALTSSAGSATVWLDWAEMCGKADDRVLDVRVDAAPGAMRHRAASCDPYEVRFVGQVLY